MPMAYIMNKIQCLLDDLLHGHILPASRAEQTKIIKIITLF